MPVGGTSDCGSKLAYGCVVAETVIKRQLRRGLDHEEEQTVLTSCVAEIFNEDSMLTR